MTDQPLPRIPTPDEEFGMRGHLFIRHDAYMYNVWDYGELVEIHQEMHDLEPEQGHPHAHTAPEPQEEWSWE